MTILGEVVAFTAAAVLAFTGSAKVWAARRNELVWPSGPNFGPYHLPLWAVVAVEGLGLVAYALLRNAMLTLLVLGIIFLGISLGAATLKGRPCGCFGIVNPNVGWLHIAGTSGLAACCLLLAAIGGGVERPLTAVQSTILVIGTLIGTVIFLEAARSKRMVSLPEAASLDGVIVVTSETCSACRALKRLEGGHTHAAVRWIDSEDGSLSDDLREVGRKNGYPMAVPILDEAPLIESAVFGLGPVRDLIGRSRKPAGV